MDDSLTDLVTKVFLKTIGRGKLSIASEPFGSICFRCYYSVELSLDLICELEPKILTMKIIKIVWMCLESPYRLSYRTVELSNYRTIPNSRRTDPEPNSRVSFRCFKCRIIWNCWSVFQMSGTHRYASLRGNGLMKSQAEKDLYDPKSKPDFNKPYKGLPGNRWKSKYSQD